MNQVDKDVVWLHGEVKTPPFSPEARLEAGFLLRRLQIGELLGMHNPGKCQVLASDATNCGLITDR